MKGSHEIIKTKIAEAFEKAGYKKLNEFIIKEQTYTKALKERLQPIWTNDTENKSIEKVSKLIANIENLNNIIDEATKVSFRQAETSNKGFNYRSVGKIALIGLLCIPLTALFFIPCSLTISLILPIINPRYTSELGGFFLEAIEFFLIVASFSILISFIFSIIAAKRLANSFIKDRLKECISEQTQNIIEAIKVVNSNIENNLDNIDKRLESLSKDLYSKNNREY
jgi:predicted house-cleaning noncanonical NTP pyrophosphatase (MazG superfamily)